LQLISQEESDGSLRFHHVDGLGSVRLLTDSAGYVTDRFSYDGYGKQKAREGSSYSSRRFRGEEYDNDTGLYYLRARYYDPETGRFLTGDPWKGDQKSPLSLNRYIYANASPLDFHDPTGLAPDDFDWSALGKAAHAAIEALYVAQNPGNNVYLEHYFPVSGIVKNRTAIIPDILDLTTKEVYEIKPLSIYGVTTGPTQIALYVATLAVLFGPLGVFFTCGVSWKPAPQILTTTRDSAGWTVVLLGNAFGLVFYKAFHKSWGEIEERIKEYIKLFKVLQVLAALPFVLLTIVQAIIAVAMAKYLITFAIQAIGAMLLNRVLLAIETSLLSKGYLG
jgi:RHS repeat-associated protein